MIISRTVNIIVGRPAGDDDTEGGILVDNLIVASTTYSSPMTHDQQLDLYLFMAAAFAAYPTAVIECINIKEGTNKFPSSGGGDNNLFSV